jgi:hypothetical protein
MKKPRVLEPFLRIELSSDTGELDLLCPPRSQDWPGAIAAIFWTRSTSDSSERTSWGRLSKRLFHVATLGALISDSGYRDGVLSVGFSCSSGTWVGLANSRMTA